MTLNTQNKTEWSASSWKTFPVLQQPDYEDLEALSSALSTIKSYPPLVFAGEVDRLSHQLAEVEEGKRFLLQGGDCAERFSDCNLESITNKLRVILQMSVIMSYGAKKPVVRVGRIAGQYTKPRSNSYEVVDGKKLSSFRGDSINSLTPTEEGRRADPRRLVKSYHKASMTLNYLRALTTGGFADLRAAENWDLSGFKGGRKEQYESTVNNIQNAIAFMESFDGTVEDKLEKVDFFTSHEGLHLNFEEAMTRHIQKSNRHYNLGAHMLWLGERTRNLEGAHVEYLRGIANPLGIKVGPSSTPAELIEIVKKLNPERQAGKITLITRFGKQAVTDLLPSTIKAFKDNDLSVIWSCDPMHGNGEKTGEGIKTRHFDDIVSEITQTVKIHKDLGTRLGGIHFELTGSSVTECVGGCEGISEQDLHRQYETACDPRLNSNQSLEMAFLISDMINS